MAEAAKHSLAAVAATFAVFSWAAVATTTVWQNVALADAAFAHAAAAADPVDAANAATEASCVAV